MHAEWGAYPSQSKDVALVLYSAIWRSAWLQILIQAWAHGSAICGRTTTWETDLPDPGYPLWQHGEPISLCWTGKTWWVHRSFVPPANIVCGLLSSSISWRNSSRPKIRRWNPEDIYFFRALYTLCSWMWANYWALWFFQHQEQRISVKQKGTLWCALQSSILFHEWKFGKFTLHMWKLRMQCPSTYYFLEISAIQASKFRSHVQDCTTRVNFWWTQRMLMSRYKVHTLFLFMKLLTVLLIPVPALWMFQKILEPSWLFGANWWGEHHCDCGWIVSSSWWNETCIQCRHQHSWEVQVHLLLPVL